MSTALNITYKDASLSGDERCELIADELTAEVSDYVEANLRGETHGAH